MATNAQMAALLRSIADGLLEPVATLTGLPTPLVQSFVEGTTTGSVKAGKTKGRKGKRPASAWNKHLMVVFREMKQKDSGVRLGDAMKVAKKTYRKA